MAQRECRRTAGARHAERNHRFYRRRHRRSLPVAGQCAGRDRRAADERHEPGRRIVRQRKDVPAAGGQERPRDETRRRGADSLHRTGAQRRTRRIGREDRRGDGQGRRARHRQKHRLGGAGLQRLSDRRPRRDGRDGTDRRRRLEMAGRRDRTQRTDYPVARGDGQSNRLGRTDGPEDPDSDRRRHHVGHAHGGQTGPAVQRPGDPRQRRVGRRADTRRTEFGAPRRLFAEPADRAAAAARRVRPQRERQNLPHARRSPRPRTENRHEPDRAARAHGTFRFRGLPVGRNRETDQLELLFCRLGTGRTLPRPAGRPDQRRRSPQTVR